MKAYIIAPDYQQFLNFKKDNPQYECEMIVEPYKLRGRTPAKIVILSQSDQLWNYQDFLEHIDRCMQDVGWKEANDELLDNDEETKDIDYAG